MNAPAMTARQQAAWPDAVAEARAHGTEAKYDQYDWHISWADEIRTGRGRDLVAVYSDGEHFVQVYMDVYGSWSIVVAEIHVIHNSGNEDCDCDRCSCERGQE